MLALMDLVINGVSTRKGRRITEELCAAESSKSTVSEPCEQLGAAVGGGSERSFAHGSHSQHPGDVDHYLEALRRR